MIEQPSYLDLISQVDSVPVGDELHGDPFSVFSELQSRFGLHQDGEA